jgi:hypothetical protein
MHTWVIVILLMLVSSAGAQELPSVVDLRAAYCIPIVKHHISVLRPFLTDPALGEDKRSAFSKLTTKHTELLRRLQLYLLPRLSHLEPLGVTTAMKRGGEDLNKLEKYEETCNAKCEPLLKKRPAALWGSCTKQCHAENTAFS